MPRCPLTGLAVQRAGKPQLDVSNPHFSTDHWTLMGSHVIGIHGPTPILQKQLENRTLFGCPFLASYFGFQFQKRVIYSTVI